MNEHAPVFENLVFEGGGVRGVAYAGAAHALQSCGLLAPVKRTAGASAGAFFSLLLALGFQPEEMRTVLQSKNFKALEDKPNPLRIATHYGLYKGDELFDWIAAQLTAKGVPEDISFAGLGKQGALDLRVFATDLNLQNTREFSARKTPDASVAGAIRASMSIPLMYAAWQFPDGVPDDHVYVDGGTVYNYPINAFDSEEGFDRHTLGFCFRSENVREHTRALGADQPLEFAHSLFSTLLRAQRIDFDQDAAQHKRSVRIDDLGFKATDLDLTPEGFDGLYESGRVATLAFLKKRQAS